MAIVFGSPEASKILEADIVTLQEVIAEVEDKKAKAINYGYRWGLEDQL